MAKVNLETLKKDIYQTYFSDGVWDIILGLVFLSIGLGVVINQNFWYLFPIILTLPLALKRSLSEPRIGTLKFKQSERMWLMAFYFLSWILVLGFIIFLGLMNPAEDGIVRWLTINLFLVIGFILAIILSLVGWFIKFPRLYVYAVLIFLGFALAGRITSIGTILTVSGILITISGIFVMKNFIQSHPKIMFSQESGAAEQ
ncbi:MAG: hypothetical protein RBT01_07265 [Anaerolineaceae bacterium]|jgi:hypothetical protein|nr:hypothetical protein [Anaerolineaceae bacterium]